MMNRYEIENMAVSLYDGGWRAEDREELIREYELSDEEADDLCEELERIGKNPKRWFMVTETRDSEYAEPLDAVTASDAVEEVLAYCGNLTANDRKGERIYAARGYLYEDEGEVSGEIDWDTVTEYYVVNNHGELRYLLNWKTRSEKEISANMDEDILTELKDEHPNYSFKYILEEYRERHFDRYGWAFEIRFE